MGRTRVISAADELTAAEAAALGRIKITRMYALLANGVIPHTWVDGRYSIPRAEFEALLAKQPDILTRRRAASHEVLSTYGRIGAHRQHALHDGHETTAAATAAFLSRFEREVDPDGKLPPAERAKRAEHAKRAYFIALAAKRRLAREASTPATREQAAREADEMDQAIRAMRIPTAGCVWCWHEQHPGENYPAASGNQLCQRHLAAIEEQLQRRHAGQQAAIPAPNAPTAAAMPTFANA